MAEIKNKQQLYNYYRAHGGVATNKSYEKNYLSSIGMKIRSEDQYGGYVDSTGFYHGPENGTISSGGGWVWQSGDSGFQTDGTYANGMWVETGLNPYESKCCGHPTANEIWWAQKAQEAAAGMQALKDYVTAHPNDWITKWIYEGGGNQTLSLPTWINPIVAQSPPTQKTTTTWEPWGQGQLPWDRHLVTKTETVPGAVTGLRPLGAQTNLTSDQLEQLMYYYGYVKGGGEEALTSTGVPQSGLSSKPNIRTQLTKVAKAKNWLDLLAYQLPNWWNDYIGLSKSLMPTKSAPTARISARWQR